MSETPARHLVLAGGGHAHLHVLRALARHPEPGLCLTVVSPSPWSVYSGMVPGLLAGQYAAGEARADLAALAARAGAVFLCDRVLRLEPRQRRLHLAARPPLAYDLLSLNLGSEPAGGDRLAAGAPAALVKPIEAAVAGIEAAMESSPPPGGRRVVVVGAGAGGCEIAFALAARLRREGAGSLTLCERADRPVPERHPRTARLVQRALARHGIGLELGASVARVDGGGVHLADGRLLPAHLVVWATGAVGPTVLAGAGLPLDERGFLRVGDDLRCLDFPEILAAGDCATLACHPGLPKAGVHAVRQAPVLEANLRALARGGQPRRYRPQRHFLTLLNTGDGRAIFSRGAVACEGRWAWYLKDWIDRRFLRRYT